MSTLISSFRNVASLAFQFSTARTFATKGSALSTHPSAPRFACAARKLSLHGVDALKPLKVVQTIPLAPTEAWRQKLLVGGKGRPSSHKLAPFSLLTVQRQQQHQTADASNSMDTMVRWRPPMISNRIANLLRKEAIANRTYGRFDATTGIGWDPAWDVELAISRSWGGKQGRYIGLKRPKMSIHHRQREHRAQQIERSMEGMDDRIEAYYAEKHARKPPRTFENKYKALMRGKK